MDLSGMTRTLQLCISIDQTLTPLGAGQPLAGLTLLGDIPSLKLLRADYALRLLAKLVDTFGSRLHFALGFGQG